MPHKCSKPATRLQRRLILAVAEELIGYSSPICSTGWYYLTSLDESHATFLWTTGSSDIANWLSPPSAGFCAILCLAFVVSWWNNKSLLSEIDAVARRQSNRNGADLSPRPAGSGRFRFQVERLQSGLPWRFHWGRIYRQRRSGKGEERIFPAVPPPSSEWLERSDGGRPRGLPPNPDSGAPYEAAANTLRAHLMITSGSCAVDPAFLSRQLREVRAQIRAWCRSDSQRLADRQIDFYAGELARSNPLRLVEDTEARERTRQYLRQINGIDKIYAGIRASVEKSVASSAACVTWPLTTRRL